ncbi:spermine synthase-like isoform X2 [Limulus polyphemus]|uniref:Spermine synthase-like isoform X2 n=1 Tax=Limulus polyphemus TaxID=6850 RepID=A0ABM1BP04_LIMPO|nr:spermine synthase-like isoform X2 [Limulus polyphemus]
MSANTSLLDLYLDATIIANPVERSTVIQNIVNVLKEYSLDKKYEIKMSDGVLLLLTVENGSLSAVLRTHLNGLITLTLEEGSSSSFLTNIGVEELRKRLNKAVQKRVDRIPILKRGLEVPNYFSSSDERIFEYDFDKLVFQADSPFQNVKILHSPTFGNTLFLDDLQNLAESDLSYTHGLMKYGELSYKDQEILILGGGDGGLLHELLKEKPKFITMVDIDQLVVDACREHLRGACFDSLDKLKGDNYEVIIGDCVKKMDEYMKEGKMFDFVFSDLTDIPIATEPEGELWKFVKKIVTMALQVLKPRGRFLSHATGIGCVDALQEYEKMLRKLPTKVEFRSHSAFVKSFLEKWVFYEIWEI